MLEAFKANFECSLFQLVRASQFVKYCVVIVKFTVTFQTDRLYLYEERLKFTLWKHLTHCTE